MLKSVETKLGTPTMRSFLMALAADSFLKVDTSSWHYTANTVEEFRDRLVAILKKHHVRLSDLFQQLDDSGDFSLSLEEFQDAMWEVR